MRNAIRFRRLTTAAAAVAAAGVLAAGTTASADSASVEAAGKWRAFTQTGFQGPDGWFGPGATGSCIYVGGNWNDKVRSARTEDRNVRVELWEHANCTGWSITIDDSGYGNIGPWVSAYRVTT
ncbi:peptidase inhibitor family I36 protein [Streptomyces sp. 4F14]|uniref:peptidase inhibitor family I36 protein n=1 Tax=Streptomyces sp. 4F14 TaxID=3394380 RepID=UPI003A838D34